MVVLFQFTPLREGRLRRRNSRAPISNFNSRPSARGDQSCNILSVTKSYFNSRPSARGDAIRRSIALVKLQFQFTPLREGRRRKFWAAVVSFVFQFTPLREGRQKTTTTTRTHTHFNSRPSARGDSTAKLAMQYGIFQFTPLREGRLVERFQKHIFALISIHAPPRGATSQLRKIDSHGQFQFTPLREGRPARAIRVSPDGLFQFTPLREGRRVAALSEKSGISKFQFTPLREGRRLPRDSLRQRDGISIHAPPRGATALNGMLTKA